MIRLIKILSAVIGLIVLLPNWGIGQIPFVQFITNPYITAEEEITIVAILMDESQNPNTETSGVYTINCSNGILENNNIHIRKGRGSITTGIQASSDIVLSIPEFTGSLTVPLVDKPIKILSSNISTETNLVADTVYYINNDIIIETNGKLIIDPGTKVLMGLKTNIFCNGNIIANGTSTNPILFTSETAQNPWGGIQLLNPVDSARFRFCIFRFGGGDENYLFGHSNSQPVVKITNSNAHFENCSFIDNVGKGLGSESSIINISHCIISRCDMGGEFHNSHLVVDRSWFLDFPDDSNTVLDDDNDALYIYQNHPVITSPSQVQRSIFMRGQDDAIDHNDANLIVKSCWIEQFYHEGIAASNGNSINVFNTFIRNCDQGIEAGYGSPNLSIDHCVMIDNGTGLRFGDSYTWGCNGHIFMSNSIVYNNEDNIRNFDLTIQGPVTGAIETTYSMTNDPEYNGNNGCFIGNPDFTQNGLLIPGSDGTGMADDGSDVGLLSPVSGYNEIKLDAQIFPNPAKDKLIIKFNSLNFKECSLKIFNDHGQLIYIEPQAQRKIQDNYIELQLRNYRRGLYFIQIVSENNIQLQEKFIIQN